MDPNTTNLDPKLKEMYNRVMSTPVPPVSPAGGPPPASSTPDPIPTPMPSMPPAPEAPVPPPAQTTPAPVMETPPTTEMHSAIPMPVAPKPISAAIVGGAGKKKGGGIFPVILVLGGIIFLAVYTVFWIKFFNLKVPFLPF